MAKMDCIPQNDLDCFYNRNWRRLNKLGSDMMLLDNFTSVQNKIDDCIYNFIIDAELASSNDSNTINMVKFRESYFNRTDNSVHLTKLISMVNNISDIKSLAYTIKILMQYGIDTLFTINVTPHFKTPDVYTLLIGDMPLTVESREVYDKQNIEFADRMLDMLDNIYVFVQDKWGYISAQFAENVLLFEILFSKSTLTIAQLYDPLITHHSMIYQDFLRQFDVDDFWETILDTQSNMYIFYENSSMMYFIQNYIKNMTQTKLSMIKDYLIFCIYKKYGKYTSSSDVFDIIMMTSSDERSLFINTFYSTFGYFLQDQYEKFNLNVSKVKKIRDMFDKMKSYCVEYFRKTSLFSNGTKIHALKKINTLEIIVGSQDYQINLDMFPDMSDNFYENFAMIDHFHYKSMIKFIGCPVNRRYLSLNNDLYSFMVNAYYDPPSNSIYLPTSITDDMFFKLDDMPINNYASLGTIIGHEIMHCFDNFGALFDYRGYLHYWWTEIDYSKYINQLKLVKDHYSNLLLNGIPLNASMSLSENIADITGLKLSLRTYMKYFMSDANSKHLSNKEKDHLQMFFKKWANTLRSVTDQDLIKYEIKYDVHSPNIIRVNAPFSHIDEYYQVYNVKPHHFNYIEPSKRTIFMDI